MPVDPCCSSCCSSPCCLPLLRIFGLVKDIVSAQIQEASAPYTYRELLRKLDGLKDKVDKAKEILEDIESRVNGNKVLNNEGRQWKEDVRDTIQKAEASIVHLTKSIEATCMCGCLPNCCRRKAANDMIQEETEKFDNLMIRQNCLVVKGERQQGSDYVKESRARDIEVIWECISQKEDVKVVCIIGTPGVGKTAVAKAVCNKALLDSNERFGYVTWVDADYGMTLKSIQEKIMRDMSIAPAATDDNNDRARRIRDELVRRRTCLVIIDFLWDFTLHDIGIPYEEAEVEGVVCKVILTSRSVLTCPTIKKDGFHELKPLTITNSWECFEKELRPSIGMDSEAKNLLMKAVEGCEGVPEAIINLARHVEGEMSGHDENASSLQEFLSRQTCLAPLTDTQFERLEYSYKRLEKDTHQKCFWYCALYPIRFPIEEEQLIDTWIWEGQLDNYFGSLEEKRKEGRIVLKVLKSARLLEKADSSGSQVKMLSLLHDLAMKIIVKEGYDSEILIKSGNNLKEFPAIDDQNGTLKYASFIQNELRVLRDQPNCPNLSTLFLQKNPLYLISNNFFSETPYLKRLDLSDTKISKLPSSVCELEFLQVLRLRDCPNLTELPSMYNLTELIVLDLFGTPLKELPSRMERLRKLKYLNLCNTQLTKFKAGIVGSLENLQELLLFMNNNEAYSWRSQQSRTNTSEAYVEELSRLNHLRTLQLNFFSETIFHDYMVTMPRPHTPHFKFCVGGFVTEGKMGENSIAYIDEYPVDHQIPDETSELYFSECRSISPMNTLERTGINFQSLTYLYLYKCTNLTFLFSFEMLHCLQNLKKICVSRCWSILGIIDTAANSSTQSHLASSYRLQKLQELVLIDLPQIESICSGQQTLEWPAFHTFSIWGCEELKRLPLIVIGDAPKVIKLRGRSFKLDDFLHLEQEEADVPDEYKKLSFVSTRNSESTPNNEQASHSRRTIERMQIGGHETPTRSRGYILGPINDASRLFKELQRSIGALFF